VSPSTFAPPWSTWAPSRRPRQPRSRPPSRAGTIRSSRSSSSNSSARRDRAADRSFGRPGLGSGVIFDKRGLVLTNFHVIKGADEITVKTVRQARVPWADPGHRPQDGPGSDPISARPRADGRDLGNSEALRVGEWAIAIGNPSGWTRPSPWASSAATGRSDVGVAHVRDFIQRRIVNPGNSGGPS